MHRVVFVIVFKYCMDELNRQRILKVYLSYIVEVEPKQEKEQTR